MKENVHEDDRKAAKTPLLVGYAKTNDYILWIHLWQNEHQWSANGFWSCILGNWSGDSLGTFIHEVWLACIGKRESDTLSASF